METLTKEEENSKTIVRKLWKKKEENSETLKNRMATIVFQNLK